MAMLADSVEVVIGVDTHKQTHTAAVVATATGQTEPSLRLTKRLLPARPTVLACTSRSSSPTDFEPTLPPHRCGTLVGRQPEFPSYFPPPDARPRGTGRNGQGRQVTGEAAAQSVCARHER